MTTAETTRIAYPSDTHLEITREFDVPRHLLFKAWTTPEHISRWLQGRGEVTIDDLRVGGTWRYVRTGADGREVVAHGKYQEIVPDERIVSRQSLEGQPDGETVNTVTFTEQGGRTVLTIQVQYATPQHRDMHEEFTRAGMPEALERLETYAASLQQTDTTHH